MVIAAKHRAVRPVERGWTRWPRHRAHTLGAAAADGLEECARQWAAAMKLHAVGRHRRQMAGLN